MLDSCVKDKLVLSQGGRFTEDTYVWFCPFCVFQPNQMDWKTMKPDIKDELGPLSPHQVKIDGIDAFQRVIDKVNDMIVLQSSTCDPYSRIWCALELKVALDKKDKDIRLKKSKPFEI